MNISSSGPAEPGEGPPTGRSLTFLPRAARFVWQRYSATLGVQVLLAGCGAVSGLALPRLLGPVGRGSLVAATLWPLTFVFVLSFSADRAAAYFIAKHRQDPRPVAAVAVVLGGAQAIVSSAIGYLLLPWLLKHQDPALMIVARRFLIGTAISLTAFHYANNMLLGSMQINSFNLCRMVSPVVYASGILVLWRQRIHSVSAATYTLLASFMIAAAVAVLLVIIKIRPSLGWDRDVAGQMVAYGAKTHVGMVTSYANQRLDQLLISLFLASSDLGLYAAAVALTDGLLIIPKGIAAVTLAHGANSDFAGGLRSGFRSAWLAAAWLVPCCLLLWILTPVLVNLFYGAAFAGSVSAARILLFGTFALGMNAVLYETVRSVNRPAAASYAELIALGATLILLPPLLKQYGYVGAAIASSVAYSIALVFISAHLVQLSRGSRVAPAGVAHAEDVTRA